MVEIVVNKREFVLFERDIYYEGYVYCCYVCGLFKIIRFFIILKLLSFYIF